MAKLKMDTAEFIKNSKQAVKVTNGAMAKMKKSVQRFNTKVKAMSDKLKGYSLGFTAAAGAGVLAIRGWIDALADQERAEKKLENTAKRVTKATDAQIQSLKDQAAALQKVGVVGDEVTLAGQQNLLTFGLQTKAVETLTPAVLDMVTHVKGANAAQEDMVTITNLVGKVMAGKVGALSLYGVTFSAAQEEILKTGTAMEKAATLAEVLDQNYGGTNETIRETTEGALTAATNAWGDFKEQLGAAVAPAVVSLANIFQGLSQWLQALSPTTKSLIGYITMGAVAFSGLMLVLLPIMMAIPFLTTAFMGLITAITLLASPIGLVVVALAGLAAAVYFYWDEIMAAITAAKVALQTAFAEIALMFSEVWEAVSIATTEVWLAIQNFFLETLNAIKFFFESFGMDISQIWKSLWASIKLVFAMYAEGIKAVTMGLWNGLSFLFQAGGDAISKLWRNALEGMAGITDSVWDGIKNSVKSSINWMINKINWFIQQANKVAGKVPGVPDIPEITPLATGGIVTRPTLAMVGEGGEPEAVIPLSKMSEVGFGGGGQSFNFYGDVSSEEAAEEMMERAFAKMKPNLSSSVATA